MALSPGQVGYKRRYSAGELIVPKNSKITDFCVLLVGLLEVSSAACHPPPQLEVTCPFSRAMAQAGCRSPSYSCRERPVHIITAGPEP